MGKIQHNPMKAIQTTGHIFHCGNFRFARAGLFLLFAMIVNLNPVQAQFRKTGTVGYTFLEIPVTARQAALGQAVGSLVNHGAILPLFVNPATLGMQSGIGVGVTSSNWIADIRHHVAGVTFSTGSIGNFGIGINFVDYGDIPRTELTTSSGEYTSLGAYTAQSAAVGITYSRQLTDKFAWGLRTNWVRETIFEFSSSNVLVDLGVIYFTGFKSLRIGGYINHFGLDSKFIGDSFKMPTELRLSFAYDLLATENHFLILIGEVSHPSDNPERIHMGLEYQLAGFLFFRTGYKWNFDEDPFAFGAGIMWKKYMLDVAVIPFGRFPSVMYLTFQKEF